MTLSIPEPIALYFAVSNGADDTSLLQCFAADAVVRDEAQTHRGHQAILAWLRAARKKFEYRVEPLEVSQDGGHVTVGTRVEGNFPGSPVQLNHVFRLKDNKIRSLEIHDAL